MARTMPDAHAPADAADELIDRAERWARDWALPRLAAWEAAGQGLPPEAFRQAAALGLLRVEVPLSQGGLGLPFSAKARLVRALARVDFGLAMSLVNTHNPAAKLAREGPAHLAERWVGPLTRGERVGCTALTEPHAGSDFAAITTHARREGEGWRLDGRKAWITNAASADVVVLYAQTEPGSGARGIASFLVEADRAGFVREAPFALGGQHTIGAGGFRLDGYRARDDEMLAPAGQAFKAALGSINGARTYIAAMCCGLVDEALRLADEHGRRRHSFGRALHEHQGWRWRTAQASAELAACSAMVEAAARTIDQGGDAQLPAAQAKLLATQMAERQLPVLAQAMGAEGLRAEHPFARHLIGARVAGFVDGSSEMLLERIAAVRQALSRA